MSQWRPSAEEERWLTVGGDARHAGGWRDLSFLARCGLFVLGAITVALCAIFFGLMSFHRAQWFFPILVLVTAEVLIISRRVFASGFEEAMQLGALVWFVLALPTSSPSAGLWLAGGAIGIVGLRLLNPLFTTLGVAICLAAMASLSHRFPVAICASFAIATVALVASTATYQRPSFDRMLGWLIVAMPLGGPLAWIDVGAPADTINILVLILASLYGCAALGVGIGKRMHAPLLAFLVCVLCVANEVRTVSHLTLEARLILGGCLALLAAVVIDQYLRNGRNGMELS